MANENDRTPLFYRVGIGAGAFLLGLASITTAVKIVFGNAPNWVLSVSRFVLTAFSVALAGILTIVGTSLAFQKIADDFMQLQRKYPKEIAKAKQRTPTFVAIAVLLSEAVVIVADNSFEGKTVETLVVSFVMLLGFGVANELMVKRGKVLMGLGIVMWILMLAFLPGAIMVDRGWGFRDLGAEIWSLPMATKLFFGLAFIVMFVLPVLLFRLDSSEHAV